MPSAIDVDESDEVQRLLREENFAAQTHRRGLDSTPLDLPSFGQVPCVPRGSALVPD